MADDDSVEQTFGADSGEERYYTYSSADKPETPFQEEVDEMTPDGVVDARREIHLMLKERYDPALEAIEAEKQEGLA